MSKPIIIDALEAHGLTMNVRVHYKNLWRIQLGLQLIRLAAWFLRSDVVIDAEMGDRWHNPDGNGVSGPWVRVGYSELMTVSPSTKLVSSEMAAPL